MVVYPNNWNEIGQKIIYSDIEDRIIEVLKDIECYNLSLSGGLDSSYMLYCMVKAFGSNNINTYTIIKNKKHPDYIYSKIISEYFNVKWQPWFIDKDVIDGDDIVKIFYEYLTNNKVKQIIACDGVDEFMCGYYVHQHTDCYYDLLNELQQYHLKPLDENSKDVKVYLPYMDEKLISMYSQIPINEKVDKNIRKKVLVSMAKDKIPNDIIERWKYGFCDAAIIK